MRPSRRTFSQATQHSPNLSCVCGKALGAMRSNGFRPGFFGPGTRKALIELQHEVNEQHGQGRTADGIYSPSLDQLLGWNVFAPLTS
jgi:hypothetical protein